MDALFFEENYSNLVDQIKNTKNSWDIIDQFKKFDSQQKQRVFGDVKAHLISIIKKPQEIHFILKNLELAQCKIVMDSLKNDLSGMFTSSVDLVQTIDRLDNDKSKIVIDAVTSHFSTMLKSKDDFRYIFNKLECSQQAELWRNKQFVLTAMQFDRDYFYSCSEELSKDTSMQIAYYVPFMACALLHPEASKSILLGLAITAIVIAAAMTGGLSILPSAALAVSTGALMTGAGFFAMKASSEKTEEITAEKTIQHTA